MSRSKELFLELIQFGDQYARESALRWTEFSLPVHLLDDLVNEASWRVRVALIQRSDFQPNAAHIKKFISDKDVDVCLAFLDRFQWDKEIDWSAYAEDGLGKELTAMREFFKSRTDLKIPNQTIETKLNSPFAQVRATYLGCLSVPLNKKRIQRCIDEGKDVELIALGKRLDWTPTFQQAQACIRERSVEVMKVWLERPDVKWLKGQEHYWLKNANPEVRAILPLLEKWAPSSMEDLEHVLNEKNDDVRKRCSEMESTWRSMLERAALVDAFAPQKSVQPKRKTL
jgi:hypothetical protein